MLKKLLLFAFVFFLSSHQIFAEEKFSTSLKADYVINEQGKTRVNLQFRIKNLEPTTYLKQYGLKLNSNRLANVAVKSNNQEIKPAINTNDNQTSLGITFPDEVVGQGKVRDFTISYDDPDIAQISGQVLEVAIPQTKGDATLTDLQVTILSPLRYGLPSKSQPEPSKSQVVKQNNQNYIQTTFFGKTESGVFIIFGYRQIFQLKLSYHLENQSDSQRLMQITLPPDTAWQKMQYQRLEPKPEKIISDLDGNWIASYQLEPNTAITVTANALAQVNIEADPSFPSTTPLAEHSRSQKYWDSDAKIIQTIIEENPDLPSLYQYVVNKLNYNYDFQIDKLDRLGALQALKKPELAVCTEFTDLFITLARAKGIPARRLAGYAYTQNITLKPLGLNKNLLHAWPEYWSEDEQLWRQVDPTWEKTSGGVDYWQHFDLNHVVFAINGVSSELPIPAPMAGNNPGTVTVDFAPQFTWQSPQLTFDLQQDKIGSWPLPNSTRLIIYNPQGQAFYNLKIDNNLNQEILLKSILPWEIKEKPLLITSGHRYLPEKKELKINFQGQEYSYEVSAEPEFYHSLPPLPVVASLVVLPIILALVAGSVLVFGRKKSNSLRRKGQKSPKKG